MPLPLVCPKILRGSGAVNSSQSSQRFHWVALLLCALGLRLALSANIGTSRTGDVREATRLRTGVRFGFASRRL